MFCTKVLGREVARIDDCFGLELAGSDVVSECGQQVAQPYVEQLLRDEAGASALIDLRTGVTVLEVDEHAGAVTVTYEADGVSASLDAEFVLGCDGGFEPDPRGDRRQVRGQRRLATEPERHVPRPGPR